MRKVIPFLLILVFLTGCMGARQDYPVQYFSLDTSPDVEESSVKIPASLWIQDFTSSPRFNPALLYTVNKYEIRFQDSNRWVERPEVMVTKLFAHTYSQSMAFESVTFGGIPKPADYTLEGYIIAFDQARDETGWTANYSVRLTLSKTIERTVIWSETLSYSRTVQEPDPYYHADAISKAAAESARESLQKISDKLR